MADDDTGQKNVFEKSREALMGRSGLDVDHDDTSPPPVDQELMDEDKDTEDDPFLTDKGLGLDENSDYMGDEEELGQEPVTITAQVKQRLLDGATRQELENEGYSKNTIRTVASNLKQEFGKDFGLTPRLPSPKGKDTNGDSSTAIKVKSNQKGAPPEEIINAIHLPGIVQGAVGFEEGMKFGLSVAVLGVRLAQELSGIGVAQAKPLLEMAKDMRAGEAAAAKSSAQEASMLTGRSIVEFFAPQLSKLESIDNRLGKVERPQATGGDPMQNMMVDIMKPVMQGLMGKVFPGAYSGGQDQSTPAGWTREVE